MLVRIVGVKRYRDRHGHLRLYYRRKGAPSVPIDASLTGAALAAEVARLDKIHLAPIAKAGTLRLLIGEYKTESNHWRGLRLRTRVDYERVFSWLGAAVDQPLVEITAQDIAKVRDKARDQHEPKFANQVVTTLKMVFRHAVEYGFAKTNPALGLSKATGGNKRANRPCTPAEANALLDEAPATIRPAIAIAIYCGIREGDICALPRNCVVGDWIEFLQGKTRRPHSAPVCQDLRKILSAIPAHDAVKLLTSSKGSPWTEEGFKTAWGRYRDKMLAAGKIGPGVTFHGLRHTGATILEESGYEESQTRHFLGHGPKSVSGHYGRSASRRKLVAEMGDTIQNVLRTARGNVVQIGNNGVYP
jgi:integrase